MPQRAPGVERLWDTFVRDLLKYEQVHKKEETGRGGFQIKSLESSERGQ